MTDDDYNAIYDEAYSEGYSNGLLLGIGLGLVGIVAVALIYFG